MSQTFRIAILGAGKVGRALGGQFQKAGHQVIYGVKDPADPKHSDLTAVSAEKAVQEADIVLIALPWTAAKGALSGLNTAQAVVIDATNPLIDGKPAQSGEMSGGELIRRWTGSSRVVKAFNTTGSANMENPDYGSSRIMMPVAGDDPEAKQTVIELASQIGFDSFDAGPLSASGDLEHLAMLWIRLAYPLGGGPNIAFSLLHR